MRKFPEKEKPDFIKEMEDRQRNIWWGDMMRNGLTLHRYLWHGSAKATSVQRIGMALFGLAFLGPGLVVVQTVYSKPESAVLLIFALPFIYSGYRLLRNAFRF